MSAPRPTSANGIVVDAETRSARAGRPRTARRSARSGRRAPGRRSARRDRRPRRRCRAGSARPGSRGTRRGRRRRQRCRGRGEHERDEAAARRARCGARVAVPGPPRRRPSPPALATTDGPIPSKARIIGGGRAPRPVPDAHGHFGPVRCGPGSVDRSRRASDRSTLECRRDDGPPLPELILYTRDGCELCDDDARHRPGAARGPCRARASGRRASASGTSRRIRSWSGCALRRSRSSSWAAAGWSSRRRPSRIRRFLADALDGAPSRDRATT